MHNFQILTIGSEILRGDILDTNFVFLAKKLYLLGYRCEKHLTVEDDPIKIEREVKKALDQTNLLFITGGLGPTCDDHTKRVLAKIFKKKLVASHDIENQLASRYGKELLSLKEQSLIPENVRVLPNQVGTAPGFFFEEKEKKIFALPGPGAEMKQMYEESVLSILKIELPKGVLLNKEYGFCLLTEGEIDPILRKMGELYPEVERGIYPGMGIVRVCLTASENHQKNFYKACSLLELELGTYIYTSKGQTLSQELKTLFCEKKLTLAAAESCTGGAIESYLVETPGASEYFLGGAVAYSNKMKTSFLEIPPHLIQKHGAVSPQVAESMLKGILNLSEADVALAVTGIAGPSGGTSEKPVGTVFCAIGFKGGEHYVWKILAKGGFKRELVINYTTHFILGSLYRLLKYKIKPLTL